MTCLNWPPAHDHLGRPLQPVGVRASSFTHSRSGIRTRTASFAFSSLSALHDCHVQGWLRLKWPTVTGTLSFYISHLLTSNLHPVPTCYSLLSTPHNNAQLNFHLFISSLICRQLSLLLYRHAEVITDSENVTHLIEGSIERSKLSAGRHNAVLLLFTVASLSTHLSEWLYSGHL